MTDDSTSRLPTLTKLGIPLPGPTTTTTPIDAPSIASNWLTSFSAAIRSKSPDDVLRLLAPDALWRDILALTWDFRTFDGHPRIRAFLTHRLFHPAPTPSSSPFDNIALRDDYIRLQRPFPDLLWIVATFDFTTPTGRGLGIVRLIPTPTPHEYEWKAYTLFTNLEDLLAFPEQIGPRRLSTPNFGTWQADRVREAAFEDGSDPAVLVIGGNHSGLETAARLKYLGVPTLVVEAHARVGDSWRERYNALCLHFPVRESPPPSPSRLFLIIIITNTLFPRFRPHAIHPIPPHLAKIHPRPQGTSTSHPLLTPHPLSLPTHNIHTHPSPSPRRWQTGSNPTHTTSSSTSGPPPPPRTPPKTRPAGSGPSPSNDATVGGGIWWLTISVGPFPFSCISFPSDLTSLSLSVCVCDARGVDSIRNGRRSP